jgi:MinD-like ATPase involved in chromosome partitioning or flagellar assembly
MYVVSFYSFRGGVGRTLALVNVGVELASKGRNVLLVDFDLEAPGIPTFDLFSSLTDTPGVVEYVSEYLRTSRAPNVREFITPCTALESRSRGGLWLMPAGRQDASYPLRFHAIDWQQLYAEREGFLMFEDLKAQWRGAVPAFDYVLIDSRTGHTDQAGICTRQLPDAVVIMFFPNEQNLRGLGKVVTDIRSEYNSPRQKRICLHFVGSNIPDLDDEENILHDQLERARQVLSYRDEDLNILHHYNSLSFLKQNIFVLDRPKSTLSREYRGLVNAVISANPDDPEGAMSKLTKLQAAFSRPPHELGRRLGDIETTLSDIARIHGHDSDILYRIALLQERIGKPEDALSMLEEAAVISPQILARRAHLYRMVGQTENAVSDAKRVLETSEKVATVDLMASLRVLMAHGRSSLPTIDSLPAIHGQDVETRFLIATELMSTVESLPAAESLLLGIMNDASAGHQQKDSVQITLVLCLIAQEKYDEAIAKISEKISGRSQSQNIIDAFNYAMAEWGKTGNPSPSLFSRVVDLSESEMRRDPNYLQCMAISHFCANDIENAEKYLKDAFREMSVRSYRSFSAWRYLEASPNEFREDLRSMQKMINGEKAAPIFFGRSRTLFSAVH